MNAFNSVLDRIRVASIVVLAVVLVGAYEVVTGDLAWADWAQGVGFAGVGGAALGYVRNQAGTGINFAARS